MVGLSPRTLRERRYEGRAPAYYRIGGVIRYDTAELAAFLRSCLVIADDQ